MLDRLANILSQLSKHLALITVVGSIFVFFSSYIYTYFFFKNINLSHNTIAMPIVFSAKTISFAMIFVMGYAVLFGFAFSEYNKNKTIYNNNLEKFYFSERTIRQTLLMSASIIALSIVILVNLCDIYIPSLTLALIFFELSICVVFFVFVICSNDKTCINYRKLYIENNKYIIRLVNIRYFGRLTFILLALILSVYVSEIANDGYNNSKNIIAGKPGNYEVTLDMEDSSNDFHNKTLMLLMQYEEKFYLIDKCNCDPIPRDYKACVYVIPDKAIISATIRKIPPPGGKREIGNISDCFTEYPRSLWRRYVAG